MYTFTVLPILKSSALLTILLIPQARAATIVEFDTREEFLQHSGAPVIENFNSLTRTTYFNNDPLLLGDLTLSVAPLFPVFNDPLNSVQVAPLNSPTWAFDGTNILRIGINEVKTFTMQFAHPVYSFGAYFGSWNDGIVRSQLEIEGSVFTAPVTTEPEVRFFGYTSDTPFSSITIRGLDNEGLFLDDVAYSFEQVPEPAPNLLLASGALMLLGVRRRVQRTNRRSRTRRGYQQAARRESKAA